MGGILATIVIGFLIGLVGRAVHPGRDKMGFVMTTLMGVGGSFLATYAGQALGLYEAGQPAGFIGGVIGAVVLILVYGKVQSG